MATRLNQTLAETNPSRQPQFKHNTLYPSVQIIFRRLFQEMGIGERLNAQTWEIVEYGMLGMGRWRKQEDLSVPRNLQGTMLGTAG